MPSTIFVMAVYLDDHLNFAEPWGWAMPTRHALGALLLEQGNVEEARAVYRADLGLDRSLCRAMQRPNNVWSLQGYVTCLERLGSNGEAETHATSASTGAGARRCRYCLVLLLRDWKQLP